MPVRTILPTPGRANNRGAFPRQQRGGERRATILEAAERIFAEVGLAGARTDAIAVAAGVNKALLYYYFKSKDDLYCAILESHLKEFCLRAFSVLDSPGSVRSKIIAYVSLHFDFISSRPYYPPLVHHLKSADARLLQRLFRKYSAPLYRRLVEIIEGGVRSRDFRPVDGHHTVFSLVALSGFYFAAAPIVKEVSHIDAFDRANVRRRKEEVLKFVRYGLFRNPEAPVA